MREKNKLRRLACLCHAGHKARVHDKGSISYEMVKHLYEDSDITKESAFRTFLRDIADCDFEKNEDGTWFYYGEAFPWW